MSDTPETVLEQPETSLDEIRDLLEVIGDRQSQIERNIEQLAKVIEPIASRTYAETQARVRALEKKILSRQERPTINRLHQLATSVQRLSNDADAKAHIEETLLDLLGNLGYEQFGEVGDPIDQDRHEVLASEETSNPVVTVVHTRGLESYGDLVARARVEIGPHQRAGDISHQEETP